MKKHIEFFDRARRRSIFFLGLFFIVLGLAAGVGGEEVLASDPITNHLSGWPQMTDINESAGVLIDADTGAVLYSLNRDEKRYPASITKIMTCLLAIENGQLQDTITMTDAGIQEAYLGSSNIVPVLGEEFTLEQCLYMLMLKSANDIATELAVHFGGSVEGFVDMMNARAAELGCTGTHFHNANGLPDDDHYTTAYDMALIMQECIKNESFCKVLGTPQYTVPATNKTPTERIYQNHCKMILPSTSFYYEYCIGGKTGYTDSAWRTLVSAAVKDGVTLVCVTLHGPDTTDFTDHAALYEYGFNNFSRVTIDENSGEGRTTGTVTLPAGVSLDSLETTGTDGEGDTKLYYTYEGNPVGSGILEVRSAIERGTAGQGDESEIESATVKNENMTARTILFVFILFLIVLALFLFWGWLQKVGAKQRRRRRRRVNGRDGQRRPAGQARKREGRQADGRPGRRRGAEGRGNAENAETEMKTGPGMDPREPEDQAYDEELAYMESLAEANEQAASGRRSRSGRGRKAENEAHDEELAYMESLAEANEQAASGRRSRSGRGRKAENEAYDEELAYMESLIERKQQEQRFAADNQAASRTGRAPGGAGRPRGSRSRIR